MSRSRLKTLRATRDPEGLTFRMTRAGGPSVFLPYRGPLAGLPAEDLRSVAMYLSSRRWRDLSRARIVVVELTPEGQQLSSHPL